MNASDAIALSSKIDDLLKDEASVLHDAIDVLLQKHKEYANVIEIYAQDPTDQSELKRLEGMWNTFLQFIHLWFSKHI